MNQDDRKQLQATLDGLAALKSDLEVLKDSLDERISNLEEAFQGGCPQLEALQEQADTIDTAIQNLEDAESDLGGL